MSGREEIEVLPCGCVITTRFETKVVQIAPCRRDCPFLAAAIELANMGAKPVIYKEGP